jgi:hypothetical protein
LPAGRPVAVEGDVANTILDDMAPNLGHTALRRAFARSFLARPQPTTLGHALGAIGRSARTIEEPL